MMPLDEYNRQQKRRMEIIQHALGVTKKNPDGYRNYFVADHESEEHSLLMELVFERWARIPQRQPYLEQKQTLFVISTYGRKMFEHYTRARETTKRIQFLK